MKIKTYLLLSFAITIILSSCKKNETESNPKGKSSPNIEQLWTINNYTASYFLLLNTGEKRRISIAQEGVDITETIEYIHISSLTQDSLDLNGDTTITWLGNVSDAYIDIKDDGHYTYVYEYALDYTENYPNGTNEALNDMIPAFPNNGFSYTETTTRTYRTEFTGQWNYANKIAQDTNIIRLLFEQENHTYTETINKTYTIDAFENNGNWNMNEPYDTTFSTQNLHVINQKYANGQKSAIWQIELFENNNLRLSRPLKHVYTETATGYEGYAISKEGHEYLELSIH
jgi:hypothetical protein